MIATALDLAMTRRACELALRGRFEVEPNPCVGAVVAVGDRIVGEGWHQRYGAAHAEVNAIAAAGAAARGASIYVSLEPCSSAGKTPPCIDAILAAGIARVVYAIDDPDPRHSGGARARLESVGIEVVGSCLPQLGAETIARFTRGLERTRPWVIAKWAMSLDGRIATRSGDSKWITNEASRAWVHRLRAHVDAIAVGVGTVIADRPKLTARPAGPRTARRVVLDHDLRTPTSWAALTDGGPEVVICADVDADSARCEQLTGKGARVLRVAGATHVDRVSNALDQLGALGVRRLLVEGGAKVLGAMFDARVVDQVAAFIAPIVVGGADAKSPVGGAGVGSIAESLALSEVRVERFSVSSSPRSDVWIEGFTDTN